MTARKVDAYSLADAIVEALGNVVAVVKDERVEDVPAATRVLTRVVDVYPWGGDGAPAIAARRRMRRLEPDGPANVYVELDDGRTYAVTVELIRNPGTDLAEVLGRMAPPG